jgi:polysaccharide export outer membrane protein
VRGPEQIPVNLKKILAGEMEGNIALRPGDMMVVPESQNRIAVLGSVRTPGTFTLTEGMKLIEAVALAGGPTDRGTLSQVIVVRLEGKETKRIVANLDRAISGQDVSQNQVLQTGDVVFVPERGFTIGQVFQWLNLFNIVRVLFGGIF